MKNLLLYLLYLSLFVFSSCKISNTKNNSEKNDSQYTRVDLDISAVQDLDGNIYPVTKLGDLYWTTKNLATTTFNDSSKIHREKNTRTWLSLKTPCYSYYKNSSIYKERYGALL